MRPRHPAPCHPKLKHYVKGLCRPCYERSLRARTPEVLADIQAERVEKAEVAKHIIVHLQMRHSVNGHFYGPGAVRLSPSQAEAFLKTEHEAAEKEFSLMQQQAFIIKYGPNGAPMKHQVPYAKFDQILGQSEVAL